MKALFAIRSLFRQNAPPGLGRSRWMTLFAFLLTLSASAQEALKNSLTGEAAAAQRSQQMQNQNYTFKYGDFRMLITPSLSAEWNDNVNLSRTDPMDDYILTPRVGIMSNYPLTQRNVLFLNFSIGYREYLEHSDLSTLDLDSSSQTGLSFDIGVKNFTFNLHDQVSYVQDSAQSATVANTANYGTFQNTAGLSGTWDLNQVTLSAGYDHQNVLSTRSQFDDISRAAEMFFARAGFKVHPKVTVGLESTASFTTYEQAVLNNNDAYTVGPYAEFRPGHYFTVTVRGGYSIYQFQQTSAFLQTSSQNSWYADVNISHQITDFISYALDAGHEERLGTQSGLGEQSDLTEDWYVRPHILWKFIRGLDINTGFFYEHGQQGVGNVLGNFSETYDWYGGDLTIEHALTSRLTLGLNYRLTVRSSDLASDEYTQNLVGLQLTYQTK
ncbi:MAG: hypothetical protein ACREFE_00175 [Limisphaerales bacterium]